MGWELMIIIGLVVFFTVAYAFGAIRNRRIQRAFWGKLRLAVKRYASKVSFLGLGSSGFKIAFKPRSSPLSKVEISLVLLAREMPLYFLTALALGRRDRMIVKANVRKKPDFHFEVFRRETSLEKEIALSLKKFKDVEAGGLSRYFKVKADKPGRAEDLLRRGVLDHLVSLREVLERFSISRSQPHILLICRRDEEAIEPILNALDTAAKALAEMYGPPRSRHRGT